MNSDDEKTSSLYHQAEKPGPSQSLDDTILAASRDAVEKPTTTKGPFSGGWPAAASIAAVIVITIILVPTLKQEEPQHALKQIIPEKSSTLDSAEEAAPDAFRPAEVKKKSMATPLPANEPATLLQEDMFTADHALPAASGISSRAAIPPATNETAYTEKEEQYEADSSATERSRMEAADSAPFAIHTPEMWEVKISRLIAEGKLEAAKAEAEKLKQHHPEYRISKSLLEQLN